MTQADVTRALIRQLYFCERVSVSVIAEELVLSPQAVRRALMVLSDDPNPVPTTTARDRRRPKGG